MLKKTQAFQSRNEKMVERPRIKCSKETLNLQFYANIF